MIAHVASFLTAGPAPTPKASAWSVHARRQDGGPAAWLWTPGVVSGQGQGQEQSQGQGTQEPPPGQDTSIRTDPLGPGPGPQTDSKTQQPPPQGPAPDITDACVKQLPFLLPIILVFYFLMIRPQQKQEKARRELLGKLQRGDRVVTNSGLHGVVANVAADTLQLLIDADGKVKVTVDRAAVGRVLGHEAPAKTNGAGG